MRIVFVIIILQVSSLSFAGSAFSCKDIFKSKILPNNIELTQTEVETLQRLKTQLREKATEEINTNRDYATPFIPKEKFHVNGREYTFLEILGAGNEGLVVYAKKGDKPVAVKFFYERVDFEENIRELQKLELSYPVVERLDVDSKNLTIVFRYIDGIGFRELSLLRSDLGTELWNKINSAVNVTMRDRTVYVFNSVLEIQTGSFYLIDPL